MLIAHSLSRRRFQSFPGVSQQPNNTNKMRNYSKTVGALAAASTLVAGYASAEIEGEVHVGYSNEYNFRFVDQGNDLIEAGIDLATEYNGFGVSAGAWYGSWDAYGAAGAAGVNADELDVYAAASYAFDPVTIELGYIYYYFPDTTGIDTQEVYLGASLDLPFGIGFGSTFYYDFDTYNGWYWDNAISYSFVFNDCLSLDLAAGVAFAHGNELQGSVRPTAGGVAPSKDGYQGYYLSAALPWSPMENLTISPYVKYTDGDSDLQTDLNGFGGGEHVIGGVTVAVSF